MKTSLLPIVRMTRNRIFALATSTAVVVIAAAIAYAWSRPSYDVLANGPRPAVGLYWYDNADPTTGSGMAAPADQLLVRTDTPSLYYKATGSNTGWVRIGQGSGGGGGSGTVTSVGCGSGVICSPSPITGAGTVSFSGVIPDLIVGNTPLASGGVMQVIAEPTNQHTLDLSNSGQTNEVTFYFSGLNFVVRNQAFGFDYFTLVGSTGMLQTPWGVQTAGTGPLLISGTGQLTFNGSSVAVACNGTGGTTCASATCNDNAGTITTNTGATSCTVTFNGSPTNAPSCTAGAQHATTTAHVASETNTVLTIALSAAATAVPVDYVCGFH